MKRALILLLLAFPGTAHAHPYPPAVADIDPCERPGDRLQPALFDELVDDLAILPARPSLVPPEFHTPAPGELQGLLRGEVLSCRS